MSRTTFAVIEKAVFGASDDFDREGFIAALRPVLGGVGWRMLAAMFHLPPDLTPYPGFLAARRGTRFLRAETQKLLATRRAAANDRRDILGLMLTARDPETGRALDDSELVANVHGFLLAGHETAAVALAWSLLAARQGSGDRSSACARKSRTSAGDGEIGADTVEKLAFTRQVLQESMRLFPPFGGDRPSAARGHDARAAIVCREGADLYADLVPASPREAMGRADRLRSRSFRAGESEGAAIATPICPSAPGRASASAWASRCRR